MRQMPVYRPIPLKTQGQPWYVQAKRWLYDARVYELTDDFYYIHPTGQAFKVPAGFRTDFASSPRPFWPLGMDPTGILLIPSLLHDFGYRHDFYLDADGTRCYLQKGKSFHDWLFKEVSEAVNDMQVPGWLAYVALNVAGWPAWWSACQRRKRGIDLLGPFADC